MDERVLLEAGEFRLVEAQGTGFRLVNNELERVAFPVLRLRKGEQSADLPASAYSVIAEQVQKFGMPPADVLAEAWTDYGTDPDR